MRFYSVSVLLVNDTKLELSGTSGSLISRLELPSFSSRARTLSSPISQFYRGRYPLARLCMTGVAPASISLQALGGTSVQAPPSKSLKAPSGTSLPGRSHTLCGGQTHSACAAHCRRSGVAPSCSECSSPRCRFLEESTGTWCSAPVRTSPLELSRIFRPGPDRTVWKWCSAQLGLACRRGLA